MVSSTGGRLTQALSRSSLQQIVDGCTHDDTLSIIGHSKRSNLDSMLQHDVLDCGGLSDDLDELLSCVTILVDLADIS